MAVNLLQRLSYGQARDTLELSFAQFQADRAVVDQARELQAEQASLKGYEAAAARAQGSDKQRWEDRARKLRRQIERGRRRVANRTGTIARTFERVVEQLLELGYLKGSTRSDNLDVTPYGELLRRIYGDRDLLIAECLRLDLWNGLDARGLAAMCCALSYEPRRDDEGSERYPGGQFGRSFDRVLERWAELDDMADRYRLPRTELPSASLAAGMFDWAKGASLEKVLEESNIGAGDFVRWAKQTIDLLDQVAQACEDAVSHPGLTKDAERLGELAQTARTAKRAVRRGIVEASSSS